MLNICAIGFESGMGWHGMGCDCGGVVVLLCGRRVLLYGERRPPLYGVVGVSVKEVWGEKASNIAKSIR